MSADAASGQVRKRGALRCTHIQKQTNRKTHGSFNDFKADGATALAPALSRLTGLTTLDLRYAPPRVSNLSRLSCSVTVREMGGEETNEAACGC